MNRARVMRAAWHMLIALGERPSRRSMQAMIRKATNSGFSTDEVQSWLRANQYRGGDGFFHLVENPGPVEGKARSATGPTHGPHNTEIPFSKPVPAGPDGDSKQDKTRSPHADLDRTNDTTINTNAPTDKPEPILDRPPDEPVSTEPLKPKAKTTRPRAERKPPDLTVPHVWPKRDDPSLPEWVRELRGEVAALHALTLGELDSDQRFLLARYHAWRWANCTKDELHNRRMAGKVASGITALAQDRRYAITPMSEYVAAGDVAWNQSGRYPMQSAWQIVGALELAGVA